MNYYTTFFHDLGSLVISPCMMQAFQAAWAAACKVEASKIIVPSKYEFLVGPISFEGTNCQDNIVFQVNIILLEVFYIEFCPSTTTTAIIIVVVVGISS